MTFEFNSGEELFFGDVPMQIPTNHELSLYWLINTSLFQKKKLEPNEIAFITIDLDSNLKFNFYEINDRVFTENSIKRDEAKKLATINVPPETCHKVLFYIEHSKTPNVIHNFERIVNNEPTKVSTSTFETDPTSKIITLKVKLSDTEFCFYPFREWQIKALMNCMTHAIKFK
jgi:hypothetical protein